MTASVMSMGLFGISAYGVTLEMDISPSYHNSTFDIVGLPGTAVKESRERVRSALKNAGFEFPFSRIIVNLAPADTAKDSPLYDLPMLMALLVSMEVIAPVPASCAFVGELSLTGLIRPVKGALVMAREALRMGLKQLFIPAENAREAAVLEGLDILPVSHVGEILAHFRGEAPIAPVHLDVHALFADKLGKNDLDFAEVRGQNGIKRAFEIAAAGGHNILLVGPPGAGKSMLAKRLPSILPPLTLEEAIEITEIHSVAGTLTESALLTSRPFRQPHHTISNAGLSGGGRIPRPGEISLAHHGVLFLDELTEFNRSVLEVLRQPMEDGDITISRASGTVSYPCKLMVVAAMNPCPCGYYGQSGKACRCKQGDIDRYLGKVSGPLLDRMDLHVEVNPVTYAEMQGTDGEPSATVRQRVMTARAVAAKRLSGTGIYDNSKMGRKEVRTMCPLTADAADFLKMSFERLGLSARSYDRILKVSRTIADLEGAVEIDILHIAEAVQYRTLDRKYWARI